MIVNIEELRVQFKSFLQRQLVRGDGFLVHLDGTLMSFVLVKLLKEFNFNHKVIVTTFSNNKQYQQRLINFIKQENLFSEVLDLSDVGNLSMYQMCKDSFEKEIVYKNQIVNSVLGFYAGIENKIILGNSCMSQRLINFPHKSYFDKNKVYCFANLWYSEICQLATHYQIAIEKPSHYFYYNFFDEEYLGFTYQQLEDLVRGGEIKSTTDALIAEKMQLQMDNKYEALILSRPGNIIK